MTSGKDVYCVADPDQLVTCISTHLSTANAQAMLVAAVYTCPVCQLILKDTHTPVATAVLQERWRLRSLWLLVEEAISATAKHAALHRFLAALGL